MESLFPYRRVIPDFASVTERYFTPMFSLEVDSQKRHDQCFLFHSNKICLVTLAPSHPLFGKGNVQKVNFQIDDDVNRLENRVSGRRKRGGQRLKENSILCSIQCDDGARYDVKSCAKANLVEVNTRLVTNPALLLEKPWSEGYVAIIMLPLNQYDLFKRRLLTQERYVEYYKGLINDET